jgi:HSP20 family protein
MLPEPIRSSELQKMLDELNHVFSTHLERTYVGESIARREWAPHVDIYEDRDALVLEVELPGLSRDDFEIIIEDNVLTLRGERRPPKSEGDTYLRIERPSGNFFRSFVIPRSVMVDKAAADYVNGVLRIVLPKFEERKAMRIQVGGPFTSKESSDDAPRPSPPEPNTGFELDMLLEGIAEEILPVRFEWDEDDDSGTDGGGGAAAAGATLNEGSWEDESKLLFVNMWVTDVEGGTLFEPITFTAGAVYQFLFAVECRPRTEISEPFVEPEALSIALEKALEVEVEVEVTCPFLEDEGHVGYARRKVTYRAHYGFDPLTFVLKPTEHGQYFLTVCMLLNREPLYNEVLTINVSPEATANAPAEDIGRIPATTVDQG